MSTAAERAALELLCIARHDNCHVELSAWPYECIAKDKHPDHLVYVCVDHGTWWHTAIRR